MTVGILETNIIVMATLCFLFFLFFFPSGSALGNADLRVISTSSHQLREGGEIVARSLKRGPGSRAERLRVSPTIRAKC